MTPEEELEKRQDIALAKLGVAEELRWLAAVPFGLLLYVTYDSWLLAIAVSVVTYFLITYWYDKEYEAARDAYERATGTGKYYAGQRRDDVT
jgi:hypothetical protein